MIYNKWAHHGLSCIWGPQTCLNLCSKNHPSHVQTPFIIYLQSFFEGKILKIDIEYLHMDLVSTLINACIWNWLSNYCTILKTGKGCYFEKVLWLLTDISINLWYSVRKKNKPQNQNLYQSPSCCSASCPFTFSTEQSWETILVVTLSPKISFFILCHLPNIPLYFFPAALNVLCPSFQLMMS